MLKHKLEFPSYQFFCTYPSKSNQNFLEILQPLSEAATGEVQKAEFKNFAIFTGKQLWVESVLIKLQTFQAEEETGAFL